MTEKYKEILIYAKALYGGCHELKMWVHGDKFGFDVYDCVRKKHMPFDNYADAKHCFDEL